jgi:AcrR family transcriptional regulator
VRLRIERREAAGDFVGVEETRDGIELAEAGDGADRQNAVFRLGQLAGPCLSRSMVAAAATEMPEKLAGCAFSLFSDRGIDRVSMDDIAAGAGVTKGSLYWHYRSKREVIHAACQHYYRGWHAQMNREISQAATSGERLTRAVRSSVRTCLIDEGNRTFTLELFTLSIHDLEVRNGWRAFFDGVKSFYVRLLQETMASGAVAPANPEPAVDLMLAAMEGYKLRALFEPELCAPSAEQRIGDELLEIIGIRD